MTDYGAAWSVIHGPHYVYSRYYHDQIHLPLERVFGYDGRIARTVDYCNTTGRKNHAFIFHMRDFIRRNKNFVFELF
ncbi:MAG: hypothetical protein WC539_01955 [Nitrospirota bacterium]